MYVLYVSFLITNDITFLFLSLLSLYLNIHMIGSAREATFYWEGPEQLSLYLSYFGNNSGQGCFELFTKWPVDEEVGGAVDGEEEVTDINPDGTFYTATVRVALEQLCLVEILLYVEQQSGQVADNEH